MESRFPGIDRLNGPVTYCQVYEKDVPGPYALVIGPARKVGS